MSNDGFKYEVAFSFLAADESLAAGVNDLLQDRYSTFFYAKRQEELVGKDGEDVFASVFGGDARTVVVFYREEWGETPWTRVEREAIRNRAHGEGYDFTLFAVLSGTPPKWLPKAQIWWDYQRWDGSGLAPIIERRVQEQGGSARVESVEDRVARLNRQLAFAEQRRVLLSTRDGGNKVWASMKAVSEAIEAWAVAAIDLGVQVNNKSKPNLLFGRPSSNGPWLSCTFNPEGGYLNDTNKLVLKFAFHRGIPDWPGIVGGIGKKSLRLKELALSPDLGANNEVIWVGKALPSRRFTADKLADEIIRQFIDQVASDASRRD